MLVQSQRRVRGTRSVRRALLVGVAVVAPALALFVASRPDGVPAAAAAAEDRGGVRGGDRGGEDRTAEGRETFRHDTFGDEAFWTDHLKMNAVIEQAVDPADGPGLGLKVDADALPDGLLGSLTAGDVQLADPQTTLALIKLDAVVGRRRRRETDRRQSPLTRVGITCASATRPWTTRSLPGIGHRLDGWPNRDLTPGDHRRLPGRRRTRRKPSTAPGAPAGTTRGSIIDGLSTPLVIPPAYGLAGVSWRRTRATAPSRTGTTTWPSPRWAARACSSTSGSGSRWSAPRPRPAGAQAAPRLPARAWTAPAPPAG